MDSYHTSSPLIRYFTSKRRTREYGERTLCDVEEEEGEGERVEERREEEGVREDVSVNGDVKGRKDMADCEEEREEEE